MSLRHGERHALFTGWRGALVALGLVVMVVLTAIQALASAERYGVLGVDHAGRIGLVGHPEGSPGWVRVDAVQRDGAAARAGVRAGDAIRMPNALLWASNVPPGTVIAAQVRHDGHTRAVPLVYQRFDPRQDEVSATLWWIGFAGSLFSVLLGVVVVVRGWGLPAALALGVGLIGFGAGDTVPFEAIGHAWTPLLLAGIAMLNASSTGITLFPALLYAEHVRTPGRVVRALVAFAVLVASATLALGLFYTSWGQIAIPRGGTLAIQVALAVGPLLTCWLAWRGLIEAPPAERSRFGVLLVALAIGLAGQVVAIGGPGGLALGGLASVLVFNALTTFCEAVAFPLVMAYAVLRHRVIDLGFALNRTMVYGTVSVILLGSFGLIEWGVEHLLPEEWIKASAWIDAGAAVCVYLAFHRVHDAVERRVEHVFFHQWQTNEQALREFVALAAHFEDAGALIRAFADELARFGGGARVALYRRNDGVLDRTAGSWEAAPKHFREDDRAFAALRATRGPLDLTEQATSLPGVLALPMIDHGALAGLVLIDAKGSGALYRPDEVALLGWAAHEVGLAIAGLHVGLVESELRLAKAQLARLTGLIGDRLAGA